MTEMTLSKIQIDEKSEKQVIVLKEKAGARALPIIIGIAEAAAIKRSISRLRPPRPMTHDLLACVIDSLGAKIEKVVIDNMEANTFYAKLIIRAEGPAAARPRRITIDARPSDSIALAVQAKSPIFVEEKVFKALKSYEGLPF